MNDKIPFNPSPEELEEYYKNQKAIEDGILITPAEELSDDPEFQQDHRGLQDRIAHDRFPEPKDPTKN
jgi:hypothetical protein